ncbi:uncharacterized protein BKA78DRAFT_313238 [Phyllosticta capitalensis]|uniref:uncharacterized protein n=1 Tax=Phyllosticta capitalensis TaxID=121624 RepID=UPI00312E53B7
MAWQVCRNWRRPLPYPKARPIAEIELQFTTCASQPSGQARLTGSLQSTAPGVEPCPSTITSMIYDDATCDTAARPLKQTANLRASPYRSRSKTLSVVSPACLLVRPFACSC